MDTQSAIDIAREALVMTFVMSAPVLLACVVVGLVVGLLQAATQVQEHTISFVPKLAAGLFVLALSMPWLVSRMVEYFQDLIDNIPAAL